MSLNGASYGYFYDAKGRRRAKTYPSSITDEYFYDQSDQLLVDQGNGSYSSPSYFTDDDYIWLGGRPVAILHGQLSTGWGRQPDSTASCGRMGDVGACGTYFPVTDHIGKVVVMVDSQARIVGTGEYDPFGQVNRISVDAETAHPYTLTTAGQVVASASAGVIGGLTTDYRGIFQYLDLRQYTSGTQTFCNNGHPISDSMTLLDWDGVNTTYGGITSSYLGNHQGRVVTVWGNAPHGAAKANLSYGYYEQGIGPTCNDTSGPPFTFSGVVMEGWEYRRYATGTKPFWTPLRFPGQYHDEETDLNQNWNRFYEPMTGRYLEAEPMYVNSPSYVKRAAMKGRAVPYYGYAGNDPITQTDPTGLMTLDIGSAKGCSPDIMRKWVEAHDIAEKMASSCKCAMAFRNEFHASLAELLSYSNQTPIIRFGTTASADYAGQQQESVITLNCNLFAGSGSSVAMAGTLVHELGHWSADGFGDMGQNEAEVGPNDAEFICEQEYYAGGQPCPNSCDK